MFPSGADPATVYKRKVLGNLVFDWTAEVPEGAPMGYKITRIDESGIDTFTETNDAGTINPALDISWGERVLNGREEWDFFNSYEGSGYVRSNGYSWDSVADDLVEGDESFTKTFFNAKTEGDGFTTTYDGSVTLKFTIKDTTPEPAKDAKPEGSRPDGINNGDRSPVVVNTGSGTVNQTVDNSINITVNGDGNVVNLGNDAVVSGGKDLITGMTGRDVLKGSGKDDTFTIQGDGRDRIKRFDTDEDQIIVDRGIGDAWISNFQDEVIVFETKRDHREGMKEAVIDIRGFPLQDDFLVYIEKTGKLYVDGNGYAPGIDKDRNGMVVASLGKGTELEPEAVQVVEL